MSSPARVLLVSDMTGRINWGARGASLALQQELRRHFPALRTLPEEFATTPVAVGSFLPAALANPLLARRDRSALLKGYYRLETTLGLQPDYIGIDPVASAANIRKHRDHPLLGTVYEAVQSADIVIVDGDGDLIFRTPAGRIPLFNLAVIELALGMGKEVHYVNSIFSDCPETGRNEIFHRHAVATLTKCASVVLRDADSMQLANQTAPGLRVQQIPDSLFLWFEALQDARSNLPPSGNYVIPFQHERPDSYDRIRFDLPFVCLSGSSSAAFHQDRAAVAYATLARRLVAELNLSVILVPTCHGDRFLYTVAQETGLPILPTEVAIMMGAAVLGTATAYVTGRYHPAIMASFGGTPCVFLGADSHKTASLQQLLEYEQIQVFPALPEPSDCESICGAAAHHLTRGVSLRQRIQQASHDRFQEAKGLVDVILSAKTHRIA